MIAMPVANQASVAAIRQGCRQDMLKDQHQMPLTWLAGSVRLN
jgi:hypothetical protein